MTELERREQERLTSEAADAYEALLADLRREHPHLSESELRDQLERECLGLGL